jgi:predicted ArsR family transcriptional regulator
VKDRILAAVAGKELTTKAVASAIGCPLRTAGRHLTELAETGKLHVERRNTGRGGIEHVYTIARARVPLLQRVWRGVHDSPQP